MLDLLLDRPTGIPVGCALGDEPAAGRRAVNRAAVTCAGADPLGSRLSGPPSGGGSTDESTGGCTSMNTPCHDTDLSS